MPEWDRNTVWIITKRDSVDGVTEVLDVFVDKEAAERRILSWVHRGEMDKLEGLHLFQKTVMKT